MCVGASSAERCLWASISNPTEPGSPDLAFGAGISGGLGSQTVRCHDALSLFYQQLLVSCLAPDVVDDARRPADDDGIDPVGRTKAEVKPRIARRLETAVGAYLGALL